MEHRDNELDRFLDRSLSEYSQEAPRSGLEQRVLANLEASAATPKRWWIWVVLPVGAAILTVAVLWNSLLTKVPPPTMANASAPAVGRAEPHAPTIVATSKRRRHRTNVRSGVVSQTPRLPTFPSQTDEAQARILLRFVQDHPAVAKQAVMEEEEFQKLAFGSFDPAENSMGDPEEER
jgi:hypothetical protein